MTSPLGVRRTSLSAVAAFAVALAGCGSDSADTKTTNRTTTPKAATTTQQSRPAPGRLDEGQWTNLNAAVDRIGEVEGEILGKLGSCTDQDCVKDATDKIGAYLNSGELVADARDSASGRCRATLARLYRRIDAEFAIVQALHTNGLDEPATLDLLQQAVTSRIKAEAATYKACDPQRS